jgi:hypothetical protein
MPPTALLNPLRKRLGRHRVGGGQNNHVGGTIMKTGFVTVFVVTASIVANVDAAPSKPPQDVNVINTPNVTVTNPQTSVTVTNPQTSVTVDNTASNPIPVTVQNQTTGGCPQYQFVGFTTSTHNGGQGIPTLTNACNQEFPGSRMCTYGEFYSTSPFPSVDATTLAWIWPWDNKTSRRTVVDTDCSAWTSALSSQSGAVVRGDGAGTTELCSSTLPVACCAPAT